MNNVWDISLYGASLEEWRHWVTQLKRQEWLTGWAIRANKIVVAISMPFWMTARILGIPLMFIDLLTFRLLMAPLRLALAPIFSLVLWSSGLWTRTSASRPMLLIVQPLIITPAMVLISLVPEDSDIRDTKYILCELWPLSRRRLQWIEEHGTGESRLSDDEM